MILTVDPNYALELPIEQVNKNLGVQADLCENVSCSVVSNSLLSPQRTVLFMKFSVCGILQARKLEWVAIPFSRGSS